jgi:hypothetical protein
MKAIHSKLITKLLQGSNTLHKAVENIMAASDMRLNDVELISSWSVSRLRRNQYPGTPSAQLLTKLAVGLRCVTEENYALFAKLAKKTYGVTLLSYSEAKRIDRPPVYNKTRKSKMRKQKRRTPVHKRPMKDIAEKLDTAVKAARATDEEQFTLRVFNHAGRQMFLVDPTCLTAETRQRILDDVVRN